MDWTNHFLRALDPQDLDLLTPHLARVRLERDCLLSQIDQPVEAAILPIDAIVSVIVVMSDGRAVESRTIGREAGFGLLNALGSPISYERVVVQVSGEAWRIPLAALREAAQQSPSLVTAIVEHAQATLVQTAQGAACNSLHAAEKRLCRWLLMTRDRVGRDLLPLKQEHLAIMLGVQRTTVTALASGLQAEGLISYSRGKITLHDPEGLRRCACECYRAIERRAELIAGI